METIHKVVDIIEKYRSELSLEILDFKFPEQEQYQSKVAASNFLRVIDKNIESILTLCRHDLTLLPSAVALSRVVIEIAANTIWLLKPQTFEEQENRFIALLDDEISSRDKYIKNLKHLNFSNDAPEIKEIQEDKKDIEIYKQKVINYLSSSYKKNK